MLGFAMRAGKLILGTELICRAMPRRGKDRIRLVAVSDTASAATKKKLFDKSAHYGIEAVELTIDMSELGRLLGKTYAPAAVAVTDDGFAREILNAHSSEKIFRKEVSDNGNGD